MGLGGDHINLTNDEERLWREECSGVGGGFTFFGFLYIPSSWTPLSRRLNHFVFFHYRVKHRGDQNMNMKQLQCVAQTLYM